jgi:hypothetical protein
VTLSDTKTFVLTRHVTDPILAARTAAGAMT